MWLIFRKFRVLKSIRKTEKLPCKLEKDDARKYSQESFLFERRSIVFYNSARRPFGLKILPTA